MKQIDRFAVAAGGERMLAVVRIARPAVPAEAAVARVAVLDFEPTCRDAVLSLTSTLRDSGIATALYLGNDDNLRGQLAWAVKGGFPFVVIMGANELAKGVVQLKDMSARTQTETPINELPTRLK